MSHSPSILDTILDYKRREELPKRKQALPLHLLRREAETSSQPPHDFAGALRRADGLVALIAEVKRASPSKGDLLPGPFDPSALAQIYAQNGATAISVLTDERFFKGSLAHLTQVRQRVGLPLLRKDFIIDPYQFTRRVLQRGRRVADRGSAGRRAIARSHRAGLRAGVDTTG